MNENNPLVSVIVTTYNRKKLLKETINSILNQTYKNFELIVVDNYSNYDFFNHIKSFNDDRIIAFQNQNNEIIAVNRNFGIRKAKGEYIAFCDDDDIWYPYKLTCQLKKFKNNPYGLCSTNHDYISNDRKKVNNKHKIKKRYLNLTFNKFILSGGFICNSSVMIKREIIETIGLFDEDPKLIAAEDYHYWARILKKYKACYIDRILISYRIDSMDSIIKIFRNNNWFKKEMYLLSSINSAAKINKIIYLIKLVKLVLVKIARSR